MAEQKLFLEHVNGLRGLCILLVFFFHLMTIWCPMGYLGVDAFFVMAGYFLIPPMLGRMERGEFRWLGYYGGKFRRIMPALTVVVLLAMLFVVLLQTPELIKGFSKHARMALLGFSNVTFGLQAADYFSPTLWENPFLHTWYISVLIQMLLVTPLIVMLVAGRSRGLKWVLAGVLMLVSGVVFFQKLLPESAAGLLPRWLQDFGSLGSVYYMTFGRVWEVLAGACIVVMPGVASRGWRTGLMAVGLLVLVLSALGVLGSWTLLPLVAVVGTMLIVRYGRDTYLDGVLTNRVLMWFGTVSFSLYLVHWVVLALYRGILPQECSAMELGVLSVVSLVVTWVIYRYVESRSYAYWVIGVAWGVTLAIAFAVRKTPLTYLLYTVDQATMKEAAKEDYEEWKLPRQTEWLRAYPRELPIWGKLPMALFQGASAVPGTPAVLQVGDCEKEPNFVLAGDSFVGTLYPGFDMVAREQGWSGVYPTAYVSPFWGCHNTHMSAYDFNRERAESFMAWLEANPGIRYVVFHQRWLYRFESVKTWEGRVISQPECWEAATEAMREFCRRLRAMGKMAVMVMPTPESGAKIKYNMADTVYGRPLLGPSLDVTCTWERYMEQQGRIRECIRKVESEGLCLVVDPAPGLFVDGVFNPVEGNHLLLTDYGHMTIHGAIRMMNAMRESLDAILRQEPAQDAVPPPSAEPVTGDADGIDTPVGAAQKPCAGSPLLHVTVPS